MHKITVCAATVAALSVLIHPVAASAAANPGPAPDAAARAEAILQGKDFGRNSAAVYIVHLDDAPLARYAGDIDGLAATSARATGTRTLKADSAASRAYLAYLDQKHLEFLDLAEKALGREIEVLNRFRAAVNGLGIWIANEEAPLISALPGVRYLDKEKLRKLNTDAGPEWIGAPTLWSGENTLDGVGTMGEGVVVGVIDSGVNTDHPSFAEVGPVDGYVHQNPRADGNPLTPDYYGSCDATTGLPYCNNKLIGAYDCGLSAGGTSRGASRVPITDIYSGSYDGTNCGRPASGFTYPAGGTSITVTASDPLQNDIVVRLYYEDPVQGEVLVAEGDLLFSPETATYTPSGGVPAGDYMAEVCPFAPGQPAGTFDGTVTWDDTPRPDLPLTVGGCTGGASPEDFNGHGSHTASTAAGNFVLGSVDAPTISVERPVSGVAPHANLITYAACLPSGNCVGLATVAAIEQATLDGVDVINYSIGGASSNPYNDSDAQAFLSAREAGIWVATSASNDGPGAATVGSPADAPWLTTVGASTHDRGFANSLVAMTGGDSPAPADITGRSITAGYGPANIVYAGDYPSTLTATPELCAVGDPDGTAAINPWPAGTFNGEIVVCDRGGFARVDKCRLAGEAGAGGCILANDPANGSSLVADTHEIPSVHISFDDGVVLKTWLADGGTDHSGTIAGSAAALDPSNGDIQAGFSSRGPNIAPGLVDVIKPDVTNPGVDVFAAVHSPTPGVGDPEFGFLSGTSMSSPHTAGAYALLKALRPEFTPAEAQSAFMMTSALPHTDSDTVSVADPFDRGAGRVELRNAARAALVMDVAAYNAGIDGRDYNIPSLGDGNCQSSCSWTRTVKSAADTTVTWSSSFSSDDGVTVSVSPASFTLAPGTTQVLTFTANVTLARHASPNANENANGTCNGAAGPDCWVFADVHLTPDDAGLPAAHLPVAARSTGDFDGDGTDDLIDVCPTSADHTDSDSDGVPDACDNCTDVANASQCDSNGDGFGNHCDADLNNNGVINFVDLAMMKAVFFEVDADADLDCNGVVNFGDLATMKSTFFGSPGPSGTAR